MQRLGPLCHGFMQQCHVRLIAEHGAEVGLPELRAILANCPKTQAFSIYDRCNVKFERP